MKICKVQLCDSTYIHFKDRSVAILETFNDKIINFTTLESRILYELFSTVNSGVVLKDKLAEYDIKYGEKYTKGISDALGKITEKIEKNTQRIFRPKRLEDKSNYLFFTLTTTKEEKNSLAKYVLKGNKKYVEWENDEVYHIRKLDVNLVSGNTFVPRKRITQDIITSLYDDHNKTVVVCGVGGVGKSEIARACSRELRNNGTIITTIELFYKRTTDSFKDSLLNSKDFIDGIYDTTKSDDRYKISKSLLDTAGKETLLIVHDFDFYDRNFLNNLLENNNGFKVIITSRLGPENFFDDGKIINISDYKNEDPDFSKEVLIKNANNKVTEEEAKKIVNLIGYHTMMASVLGRYIRVYGANGLIERLERSFNSLSTGEKLTNIKKDNKNIYVDRIKNPDVYDVFKTIFSDILSKKFNEFHRQVFGAMVLLPTSFCTIDVVSELIGDLPDKSKHCNNARDAIIELIDMGYLFRDNDDNLSMHLLIEKAITTENEFGETICQISDEFKCHLLNNYFVSNIKDAYAFNNLFWNIGYCSEYIEYDLDSNYTPEAAWAQMINEEFTTYYPNNHIFDKKIFTSKYSKLSLFSFGIDDFSKISSSNVGWILHQKDVFDEKELDKFINGIKYNSNINSLEKKDIEELFDPSNLNRIGLFFVLEYKSGRSIVLYDYQKKQSYIIVNLCEQLIPKNRYFDNKLSIQKDEPLFVRFVGSTCGKLPEILIIPEKICGAPVTEIYRDVPHKACNAFNKLKILSIPKYVKVIGECAFNNCNKLKCVLFLNESTIFERGSFSWCEGLEKIFLPYVPVIIRENAFEELKMVKQITIPNYTQFSTNLYHKKIDEFALLSILSYDGYYYQTQEAIYNSDDTTELYKFDIRKIIKCWKNLDDIYDETGCEKLRWDEFYRCWQSAANGLQVANCGDYELAFPDGCSNCTTIEESNVWLDKAKMLDSLDLNVNFTIGKDVYIYQPEEHPIVVILDEPEDIQVNYWNIHCGCSNISFPFRNYTVYHKYNQINPSLFGDEYFDNRDEDDWGWFLEDTFPTNVTIAKSKEEHIISDCLSAEEVIDECIRAAQKRADEGNFECAISYIEFADYFMDKRPELFLRYTKYSKKDLLELLNYFK